MLVRKMVMSTIQNVMQLRMGSIQVYEVGSYTLVIEGRFNAWEDPIGKAKTLFE